MEENRFAGRFVTLTTEQRGDRTIERVYVRNGVSVIPVLADGRIRCIEEEDLAQRHVRTKLVSGWLDDEEDPSKRATKELEEEIGLHAGRLSLYLTANSEGAVIKAQYYFIARDLTVVGAHPEPDEKIIRTIDLPLDEIRDLVLAEKFGSGSTAFALLKFCTEYETGHAGQGPQ